MVIVAAVDRSDRARAVTREAEAIARAFDDRVHVVHVLTRSEFVSLGRTQAESGDAIDMVEIRDAATGVAAEASQNLAVPSETIGLVGDPADRVVEYATQHDARYIVTAPRKRSPTGKVLFGSVAQSILLEATCPVISTIPHAD